MASIPVLRDDEAEVIVPETTIIIEYLKRIEADGPPMIPADADEALDSAGWDRFLDQYVLGPCRRSCSTRSSPRSGGTRRRSPDARRTLDTAYDVLEGQLAERELVAGSGFTGRRLRGRAGAVLRLGPEPVGRAHAPQPHALLPRPRPPTVVREGHRRGATLPGRLSAAVAGGPRPLPREGLAGGPPPDRQQVFEPVQGSAGPALVGLLGEREEVAVERVGARAGSAASTDRAAMTGPKCSV